METLRYGIILSVLALFCGLTVALASGASLSGPLMLPLTIIAWSGGVPALVVALTRR